MSTRRVVLAGFGPVGRAFARLIERPAMAGLDGGHDIDLVAIATRRGTWFKAGSGAPIDALTPGAIAEVVERGTPFTDIRGTRRDVDGASAIDTVEADLLVEATPTDLVTGEPGASHIRAALGRGWDVVAASKGGLVVHGPELVALAGRQGVRLRYGAAAAAALPTLDVARWGLTGARVERIEGILNGTSNAILSAMRHDGIAYADALARMQAAGIAERDPRLDVSGLDTAAKLVLIAHAVWGRPSRLADAEIAGIEGISVAEVANGSAGGVVRLVGSAWLEDAMPRIRVAPIALPTDHPLAAVDGPEKAITFSTDTLGRITVAGGASSPVGAAAAILRDIRNLDWRHGTAEP